MSRSQPKAAPRPRRRKGRRQRKEGGDLRLAGEQKRLHSAEQLRWLQGGEMSREDFVACLRHLHERFPSWMPELV